MNLRLRPINQTLSFKLNTLLVAILVTLMTVILLVISVNFQSLLRQSGRENIEQDVDFVQRRMIELERDIQNAARLMSNSPTLVQAITDGDAAGLRASVLTDAATLNVDYVDILDADRNSLLNQSDSIYSESENHNLINLGLFGVRSTALVRSQVGEEHIVLAAVTPIRNPAGEIIGSLVASTNINEAFLNRLNLERETPRLGFLFGEKAIARNFTDEDEFTTLEDNQGEILRALNGEVVISDDIGSDQDRTPGIMAYVPITIGGEIHAVMGVERDFEALIAFQGRLTETTVLVVAAVTLILVGIVALFVRQSIARPINALKVAAEQMASGDLSHRAAVKGQDELGQLGNSFNKMADQIKDLFSMLNERVVETEAARQRAEHSDKVKSSFLASMSHELRTPLNAIINFTKFVAKGQMGPVTEEQKETLGEVVDSAKHLLNLINDVLDMSKIESGTLTLFVTDNVDLRPILNQAVTTAKGLIDDKEIEIEANIAEDLPRIRGDRQRLTQIFLNILSNACKFTEEGLITLSAQRDADNVVITIKDTGAGIAPEDLGIVFEAFKQTESGLRQGGGTGLGMPITKNLVEAHDGHIKLESQIGAGTTFFVTLPITSTLEPTLTRTRSLS